MNPERKILYGHLLTIFTIIIWGTTFVSSKILLQSLSPVELLLDRFILGYLALWVMSPKFMGFKNLRHELLFVAAGLSGVCLYYLFENIALMYTQAANASVIVSTAPLFVSILAYFFLREEKLSRYFFVGFACAIFGIALLSFGGGNEVAVSPVGDLLCLLAAFTWGVYSIIIKKGNRLGYPVILVTRRVFFYGILFMLPIAWLMDYQLKYEMLLEPVNLGNLLFLGIIACAVCFATWNKAVDLIGAVTTSTYIYASPVITLIASILILDETVTVMMICGIAMTIVGLAVSQMGKR